MKAASTSHYRSAANARIDAATKIVLALALVRLAIWAAIGHRYGIFRDELYYLACSEHLDWGYVDQPPAFVLLTWIVRHTLGESLHALRFLPAVAGAVLVWMTARLARRMGGSTWAQVLAALAALVAPIYLALSHLLTMNAFEPLLWTGIAYLAVAIAQTGNQRLWVGVGVLAGIAFQTKYSVAFLLLGLLIGIVLTPLRRALASRWLWIGAAIALLIALPNILWQVNRGLPFLELMRNIAESGRDVKPGVIGFFGQQLMIMHPLMVVLWGAGLIWLFTRAGRPFRVLGWMFATVFGVLLAMQGKNYYVAPAYPLVFAAGGVALEQWTRTRGRSLVVAWLVLLLATSALLLPMALPVLHPETYIAYSDKLGLKPPAAEHQSNGPLDSQLYADMFGWREMTQAVAQAWGRIPPQYHAKTAIVGNNYGQSGAIDFFGADYGLPKSIGVHQNYWYWGPRGYTGESLLVLGDDLESLAPACESVEKVGRVEHPLSRRDEHFDLLWCRGLKTPLPQAWPELKEWN